MEFDRAAAFVVGAGRILVVGDDGSGAVATLLLDDTGATTVPLREPRVDATAIELPTGHVALVGGARLDGTPASSVELYVE